MSAKTWSVSEAFWGTVVFVRLIVEGQDFEGAEEGVEVSFVDQEILRGLVPFEGGPVDSRFGVAVSLARVAALIFLATVLRYGGSSWGLFDGEANIGPKVLRDRGV